MIRAVFIALLLVGCTATKDAANDLTGGWGLDLPFLDMVYECDATVEQPAELVLLELCTDLDQEALQRSLDEHGFDGVTCWPTNRHAGPCIHCCGDDCGPSGSNAHNGSWCPDE